MFTILNKMLSLVLLSLFLSLSLSLSIYIYMLLFKIFYHKNYLDYFFFEIHGLTWKYDHGSPDCLHQDCFVCLGWLCITTKL